MNNKDKLKIVNHPTAEDCLCCYFACKENELHAIQFLWSDGECDHVWGMRRYLRNIKQRGTWGFVEDKKRIHIWFQDCAKPVQLIQLLAHEMGHLQKPFNENRNQEETKANNYSYVAATAYEIMQHLKGEIND